MEQLFSVVETVMSALLQTSFLLVLSNLFMTFAWYGHLKNLGHRAWYVAALLSWGIALFEYLLQVPANRIGYGTLSLAQLKVLQVPASSRRKATSSVSPAPAPAATPTTTAP